MLRLLREEVTDALDEKTDDEEKGRDFHRYRDVCRTRIWRNLMREIEKVYPGRNDPSLSDPKRLFRRVDHGGGA